MINQKDRENEKLTEKLLKTKKKLRLEILSVGKKNYDREREKSKEIDDLKRKNEFNKELEVLLGPIIRKEADKLYELEKLERDKFSN